MAYDDVEEGILNILSTLATYTVGDNLSRGDARVIAKGRKRTVILHTGGISGRQVIATPRKISTNWQTDIELRIRFNKDVDEIHQEIIDARQEIMDTMDIYPTLNGVAGVKQALITGASQPEVWQGEARNYWVQNLSCSTTENVHIQIIL